MSPLDKKMNACAGSPCEPDGNRLDSWKEIAAYLHRAVRTVQRWQKFEGLPVHRHFHEKASSVYAFGCEVDAWLKSRCPALSEPASKKQYSEHASKLGRPTLLVAKRMPARSRPWLENPAAGAGSLDLLQGEDRIRLYFYLQLRPEPDASSSLKNSVTHGKGVNPLPSLDR